MKKSLICFLALASVALTYLFTDSSAKAFASSNNCMVPIQEDSAIVATDIYDLSLRLKVPQVVNNSLSTGSRKFQNQTIRGQLYVQWRENGRYTLDFGNLENKNFKVGKVNVKYTGYEDSEVVYPRFNYIGNNATETFRTPCICFYLELEPSYAIGGNSEDNSFFLLLSGKGTSTVKSKIGSRIASNFHGYVTGTQGCGCYAYGHKSPTRVASMYGPSEVVEDVVPTFGTWDARWKKRVLP